MKKLLIPLLLLLVGVGGGVGAGLALAPAPAPDGSAPDGDAPPTADGHEAPAEDHGGEDHAAAPADGGEDGHADAAGDHAAVPAEDHAADDHGAAPAADDHGEAATTGHDYVRLNNQFVVPVVEGGDVASLVLLSLSVEVVSGQEDAVLAIEPKLRDVFLQVLFDHANTGGFEGMFTAAAAMRSLRAALLGGAQDAAGELVTDVLIVELVRQDQ